ncbi:MAG: methyltransferase [Bacteroidetes bacterium HGW-Bacteroidetes-1]|jgi:predicted O-methyltransferase YrrM|nr:MAG: methyltransferase [Bacteroidetes bacterium HGW-Bacteroidetes-1]
MLKSLYPALSYLSYLRKRKSPHGIHSPFVFEFATNVLSDKKKYKDYSVINKVLRNTFKNRNLIETVDFGAAAGGKAFSTYRARVCELAKKRSHPIKYNYLLYRIVKHFNPTTILEFGTSTGFSTISLALGNPQSKIITIEGCSSIATVAQSSFDLHKLENIDMVLGDFNNVLLKTLQGFEKLDLVFFDGNHRKLATLNYFQQCLTKATPESIFIFDDIHWSKEMEEAWKIIKSTDEVSLSIDVFQFGIIFFRKGIEKQHFILTM